MASSPERTRPVCMALAYYRQMPDPLVDRREVGRRLAQQVLERVDDEVGVLVAVDLVLGAHDALQIERQAPRLRIVDAVGELPAGGKQSRAVRAHAERRLHQAELDRV